MAETGSLFGVPLAEVSGLLADGSWLDVEAGTLVRDAIDLGGGRVIAFLKWTARGQTFVVKPEVVAGLRTGDEEQSQFGGATLR